MLKHDFRIFWDCAVCLSYSVIFESGVLIPTPSCWILSTMLSMVCGYTSCLSFQIFMVCSCMPIWLLHMLGKHSTVELHPLPFMALLKSKNNCWTSFQSSYDSLVSLESLDCSLLDRTTCNKYISYKVKLFYLKRKKYHTGKVLVNNGFAVELEKFMISSLKIL
jgi:hypothetical protein